MGATLHELGLAGCLLLVVGAVGCQTLQPETEYDADVDFARFRTFAWIDASPLIRTPGQPALDPSIEPRLMNAIRTGFETRGLRFVEDAGAADLAVAFTLGSRRGIQESRYPPSSFLRGATGRASDRWGGEWRKTTIVERAYLEGQLAIDVFEVATARPVWFGTVSRRITEQERDDPEDVLVAAVEAIVLEFPPD